MCQVSCPKCDFESDAFSLIHPRQAPVSRCCRRHRPTGGTRDRRTGFRGPASHRRCPPSCRKRKTSFGNCASIPGIRSVVGNRLPSTCAVPVTPSRPAACCARPSPYRGVVVAVANRSIHAGPTRIRSLSGGVLPEWCFRHVVPGIALGVSGSSTLVPAKTWPWICNNNCLYASSSPMNLTNNKSYCHGMDAY